MAEAVISEESIFMTEKESSEACPQIPGIIDKDFVI